MLKRSPLQRKKPMARGAPLERKAMKRAAPKRKSTAPLSVEKAHKAALVELGCAVCWRLFGAHEPGPVELHHLRADGWGKGDYTTLIPLCVEHHRGGTGVHGLGTKGFAAHYGFDQRDLLEWALGKISQPQQTGEIR